MLVIDASIAATWLFDDEQHDIADQALEHLCRVGGLAPILWQYEIRNLLLVGVRRGRIDATIMKERLAAVELLPIQIDRDANFSMALAFAETHQLSFYDALYLELTFRCGGSLASLDKRLVTAALQEKLAVLGKE